LINKNHNCLAPPVLSVWTVFAVMRVRMMVPINLTRLEYLIMARLSVDKERKAVESGKIRESLYAYVAKNFSRRQWREYYALMIRRLAYSGFINEATMSLTDSGIEQLTRFVGGGLVPWRTYKRIHFPALALGLQTPHKILVKRIQYNQDQLIACVIANRENLDLPEMPTINQAMDAIVWNYLGVGTNQPLSLNRIRELVLARRIGAEYKFTNAHYAYLRRLFVAKLLGAKGTQIMDIQQQLITEWLLRTDDE